MTIDSLTSNTLHSFLTQCSDFLTEVLLSSYATLYLEQVEMGIADANGQVLLITRYQEGKRISRQDLKTQQFLNRGQDCILHIGSPTSCEKFHYRILVVERWETGNTG